ALPHEIRNELQTALSDLHEKQRTLSNCQHKVSARSDEWVDADTESGWSSGSESETEGTAKPEHPTESTALSSAQLERILKKRRDREAARSAPTSPRVVCTQPRCFIPIFIRKSCTFSGRLSDFTAGHFNTSKAGGQVVRVQLTSRTCSSTTSKTH